jgi:hypothetical protein
VIVEPALRTLHPVHNTASARIRRPRSTHCYARVFNQPPKFRRNSLVRRSLLCRPGVGSILLPRAEPRTHPV